MSNRNTFSGTLGFVLAAAGSAVGLGNIWRFPYLAAKDGGGIFLVMYITLALTFGFTLLVTEVSIGRKTHLGPLAAYEKIHKKWKWMGTVASVIPFLILPYYCVIGGWVLKYAIVFVTGNGVKAAGEGFFDAFVGGIFEPLICTLVFIVLTSLVVLLGVKKGIESICRILMPILFLLVIGIAVFSLTLRSGEGASARTGIEGFLLYVVPDVSGMRLKDFLIVMMDAMGQLFYSISICMGILIAYGSYLPDESNLMKSVSRIEICDTVFAFLAGVMIIPAVYVFMGREGMSHGPGLMFEALPKVFADMGPVGNWLGAAFFIMVFFAALTSSISILEAIISGLTDKFKITRRKATFLDACVTLVLAVIICLGYNLLYFDFKLPNGVHAQILDVFDYAANNILMPSLGIATCILIGWVVYPKVVIDEATKNGEHFHRRRLYILMIKVIAPLMLFVILLSAFGVFGR